MSGFLKQSTASQSRAIGPFLDDTDFKTAETALTIANTDIKLIVNGGASANKNSGGGTHRINGVYGVTFDATDTATVGEMEVSVVVAGALPVWNTFTVLEEAVYDALFGASALGYVANAPVNVAQISGDATAADNLENAFDETAGSVIQHGIVDQGTAQSATASTLVLRAAAAFADDELNGAIIVITGGTTGVGQVRVISDYVSTTDTATVSPDWTTTPSGTIAYKVYAAPPAPTAAGALPQVQVAAILQAALADMFDTNSGTTYASAVAGSVVKEIAAGVPTVALTESYAADGAAPTLAQAIFAIQQFAMEKSISGTTLTVMKLDGATTAMTFTLSDATTPTSITRAT